MTKAHIFIHEIFKKFPRLFIVTVLLVVIVGVLEASSLLTVGPLVDLLIHPDLQNISPFTQKIVRIIEFFGIPVMLSNYLVIFVIFIIISSAFRILARRAILKTQYAVLRNLMVGTFEDFFNARWFFFSSGKQGVFINTFMRELNIAGSAFGAMAYFFASAIQLGVCLVVPFYISWQVTTISFIAAFFLSIPFLLLGKITYRLGKANTETSNKIGSVIGENLTLAKVVLGFGNQHKSKANLASTFDIHREITIKLQTIDLTLSVLYRPLGVIVLAVALFSARQFGVPISDMTILLLALLQAVVYVGDLTLRQNSLNSFFPSYEQIKNLRSKAKELKQVTGSRLFEGFKKELAVERVSFSYPGHKPILDNVSIKIPKGEMIAIVGESGAGKTTLIDMIIGFNESAAGRIAFDGVDLREFDINSYRKIIGYVSQDSILFNMSIKDNLLWAKDDASDEEVKHACQLANAAEFIERFPDKFNTVVGDRGVRLSGGQLQRVSLARAILRKPILLILDEATSSLDTKSERLIQQAIEKIAKETTIIVIAHRLSTIVNADYVYVLKEGRIVEEGTYSELIEREGHFDRMVKLQLLGVSQ